jgi:hypothetical protein
LIQLAWVVCVAALTFWTLWAAREKEIRDRIDASTSSLKDQYLKITEETDRFTFVTKGNPHARVIFKPSFRSPQFWFGAIVVGGLANLPFVLADWFGGKLDLRQSVTGYTASAALACVNWLAALFGATLSYFLATRALDVLPWRLHRFVHALIDQGVLLKEGEGLRVMHLRVGDYLKRRARYRTIGDA